MTDIESYIPDFVPKPISWGKFKQASAETFFYLMEFMKLGLKSWSLQISAIVLPSSTE